MKKILYISHSIGINGAEQCLLTLLKHLDRERFTPIVVLPDDGLLRVTLMSIDVKTIVLPLTWWIPPTRDFFKINYLDIIKQSETISEIIKEEDINIVHTNTSVITQGALAAKMTGRPHVWHLHEILNNHPSLQPTLPLYLTYKYIDLLSDTVVVVSDALERYVSEGIKIENIRIIHNGIDIQDEKTTGDLRKELGIPDGSHLICAVGSIVKEKDYGTFVEAARRVIEKNKDVRFLIIGEGDSDLLSTLNNSLRDNSIKRYFKFLGYRRDLRRILNEIDILVVSSITESFGLTCVEAMAAGKPVIATKCGGPEEIVLNDETGLLVPVGDADSMAGAILSLIDNPGKGKEMGVKGRKRYEALFTAERYCNAFEGIYEKLTSRRSYSIEEDRFANSLIELLTQIYRLQNVTRIASVNTVEIPSYPHHVRFMMHRYFKILRSGGLIEANKKALNAVVKRVLNILYHNGYHKQV